ncbi:hypothetical protein Agub_g6274 [Astrephomene gubernaculifera]|uniref:FAD dependent oxidoreductase domain-containing protein n=1 Tax=Astrephomene gubernaculifera TaxID=47775 RepID=A0AAD3DPQ2_9CHLO|nr:hypothetical protein Agub_g6274 [Astrephomene gubernaculifera]
MQAHVHRPAPCAFAPKLVGARSSFPAAAHTTFIQRQAIRPPRSGAPARPTCSAGFQQLCPTSPLLTSRAHLTLRATSAYSPSGDCSNATITSPAAPPPPIITSRRPLHICIVGAGVVGLTTALRLLQLNQDPPTPHDTAAVSSAPPLSSRLGSSRPRPRRVEITVLASDFGRDTTTAGAAGLWGPYKLSDTPEELVCRWGGATYTHLMELAHSRQADAAGVMPCAVNSFFSEAQPLPFWRHIPFNFATMDPRHLDCLGRGRTGSSSSSGSGSSPPSGSAALHAVLSDVGRYREADPPPLPCGWGYHWSSVVCEGARYLAWLEEQYVPTCGQFS